MGYALSQIKDELVDFELDSIAARPNPSLYMIHFRRNISNTFGSVVPIKPTKGNWEFHSSYETEKDMLKAFDQLCKRPNVQSGLFVFRCVWPDGRMKESGVSTVAIN